MASATQNNNLLKARLQKEEPVFGVKSKPRSEEPKLMDLMKLPDDPNGKDKYKVNKNLLKGMDEETKAKYKISKSDDPWVTESRANMQNFSKKEIPPYERKKRDESEPMTNPFERREVKEALRKNEIYRLERQYGQDHPKVKEAEARQEVERQQEIETLAARGDVVAKQVLEEQVQAQAAAEEEVRKQEEAQNAQSAERQEYDEDGPIPDRMVWSPERTGKRIQGTQPGIQWTTGGGGTLLDKEEEARRKRRVKKLMKDMRWMADSATQTYLGKPAFNNYGMNSTKPTVGGIVYGQYMNTHNVNPHRGPNYPEFRQIYKNAEMGADRRPPRPPTMPRKALLIDEEEDKKQIELEKARSPLEPEKTKKTQQGFMKPNLVKDMKFGTKTAEQAQTQKEEKKEKKDPKLEKAEEMMDKLMKGGLGDRYAQMYKEGGEAERPKTNKKEVDQVKKLIKDEPTNKKNFMDSMPPDKHVDLMSKVFDDAYPNMKDVVPDKPPPAPPTPRDENMTKSMGLSMQRPAVRRAQEEQQKKIESQNMQNQRNAPRTAPNNRATSAQRAS